MYPSRMILRRLILSFPPLKASYALMRLSHSRLFTQNSQLLLISPTSPRPQLPFLHNSSSLRSPRVLSRKQFQLQLSRLLTTERKRYIKDQVYLGVKWSVHAWVAAGLILIIMFGIDSERLEHRFPSPSEWSWISRNNYRKARGQEDPNVNGTGLIDWASTGNMYRMLLRRLEDHNTDGDGLSSPLYEEGDIYVAGVGRTGLDISAKSEPWRRGYYLCLMGAARAAEHLDGWVRDTTRNIAFPAEVVIGPSNPRPKPVPFGAKTAPLEEHCEPGFEAPETYYMKILTTQGFSTRQRLDAALAYADWLEFKGLPSSAKDMYDWGLDIAMGALPLGVDNVVNPQIGVIDKSATYVTPNILLATTSLANHHARNKNLSGALPIFLSVLRTYRALPTPSATREETPSARTDTDLSTLSALLSLVRSSFAAPPYPPPPRSGDVPATRTPTVACDEAGVMAHIGEILFASSSSTSTTPTPNEPSPSSSSSSFFSFSFSSTSAPAAQPSTSQQAGLSWTRESVSLAEATLHALSSSLPRKSPQASPFPDPRTSKKIDNEARTRCTECLAVGTSNWQKMVSKLQKLESAEREALLAKSQAVGGKKEKDGEAQEGWFWRGGWRREVDEVEGRWAREAKVVEQRVQELRGLLTKEGFGEERDGSGLGGILFG